MKIYNLKKEMYSSCNSEQYENTMFLQFLNKHEKRKFTSFEKDHNLFKNIDQLKILGKYYAFEIVKDRVMRKPYLDLDKVYPDEATMIKKRRKIIPKLVADIIRLFKAEYNQVLIRDDIKILESSGKTDGGYKLSLHLVVSPDNLSYYYTSGRYNESSAFHLYTSLLKTNPEYADILDQQVYNKDASLRIIGSHKSFKNDRGLIPISSTTLKPIELNTKKKLNYFLTYMQKDTIQLNTPIVEQSTKRKNQMSQNTPTKTHCCENLLKLVKRKHPSAYSTGCNGVYNFNYKNRKEPCPITGRKHLGTNGFYVTEWSGGYHLRCHSAYCKGKLKHIGYVDETDETVHQATQVTTQYLSDDKLVNQIVDNFIEESKVLAIKSFMGTGKTVLVNQILGKLKNLEKFNVLWITHRQTLTKAIFGAFKKFGFKNYMDEQGCLFDYNRIIVQIDSLHRLFKETENDGETLFKKYDLVIIDESEGALNHFSSPYLNKNGRDARSIFDQMTDIIDAGEKLLLLDADMHTRTRLLMDRYRNQGVEFIHNTYVPDLKTLTLTNSEEKYLKKLYGDVEHGLKICIVSMSSDRLTVIYDELVKRKVKCVIHTSKTDDSLKTELENVNKFWKQFQCVLYSPVIESGVSFDEHHFDKIYGIVQDGFKTCSQRSFLQQLGRIRHCDDKNIYCLYNGLRNISNNDDKVIYSLDGDIYTFDDVLGYVKNYEFLNGKKILRTHYQLKDIGGAIAKTLVVDDLQLFDQIVLHNEVEELNKHPHTFLTVLNRLAMRSNFKLEFDYVEKAKRATTREAKKKAIDRLVDANVEGYDIDGLKKKQAKTGLTAVEKSILEKLYFIKTFKVQDYNDRDKFRLVLENLYGKESVLYRYKILFGYKDIYSGEYDNIKDGSEKSRIKIVTDIVNLILDKNYEKLRPEYLDNLILSKNQYISAIDRVFKNSLYFKNESKYRSLFFQTKASKNKKCDNNKYFNIISDILEKFNIIFKRGKQIRVGNDREFQYCLSVGEQIKDIC